jgi:hypothetical protein
MESGTSIPGCPNPLPLFRPEAVAARQAVQGQVLTIRPLPWMWFAWLIATIIASALALLLFSHYQPRARASGVVSSVSAASTGAHLEATFDISQEWTGALHPGTSLLVHCAHCSDPAFTGIVTGIVPDGVSPELARSEPVYKVTVAVSIPNSLSAGTEQFRPGTKLEAEFPLQRRPLIRALIGAGAW